MESHVNLNFFTLNPRHVESAWMNDEWHRNMAPQYYTAIEQSKKIDWQNVAIVLAITTGTLIQCAIYRADDLEDERHTGIFYEGQEVRFAQGMITGKITNEEESEMLRLAALQYICPDNFQNFWKKEVMIVMRDGATIILKNK